MPSLLRAENVLLFPKPFHMLPSPILVLELRSRCLWRLADLPNISSSAGVGGWFWGFCLHTSYFFHNCRKEYSSSLMCGISNFSRDCANKMLKGDVWCYSFCETLSIKWEKWERNYTSYRSERVTYKRVVSYSPEPPGPAPFLGDWLLGWRTAHPGSGKWALRWRSLDEVSHGAL